MVILYGGVFCTLHYWLKALTDILCVFRIDVEI
jgi:hypothetical protein